MRSHFWGAIWRIGIRSFQHFCSRFWRSLDTRNGDRCVHFMCRDLSVPETARVLSRWRNGSLQASTTASTISFPTAFGMLFLFELALQTDRIVGASDAFLVIDDTGLPKKGDHSVGVAPQYASMLGKRANCQTLVSVTLARDEVPVPVGLRLFLPDSWIGDHERMAKAGVPDDMRTSRTKPEIALAEIDRLIVTGVRFGTVLADAGYGLSAAFRKGLSERGLTWAVGIPKHQKVYPDDVRLIFPVSGHGRPRKHSIPDTLSVAAETMLASASWKKVSWRRGTKGRLTARFAALRIRIADGTPQRIYDK